MQAMVIFEKSNRHVSKFIDLLKTQEEIKQVEIKKLLSRSSYYAIIIKKIFRVNKILQEINPKFYLAEPSFSVSSGDGVYASLKRCPLIDIETRKDFFIVKCKNGKEDTTHPNPRNA